MKNKIDEKIKKLPGPCLIFGAGGFVGFNLFGRILSVRSDVFGVFSDPKKNWRLKTKSPPPPNVVKCDIRERGEVKRLISRIKPQSVFNLSAYGAYSSQTDIDRIYKTNFNSTYVLIEELKKYGFAAYIHAGSQSEYGLNSAGPNEQDELIPNSHYAVSKAADYYVLKYYGRIEKLPVVHLRLYSVYGPWEEPSRLMSTLISSVKKGKLPPFVNPDISRDFVYADDVVEAMVIIAHHLHHSERKIFSQSEARYRVSRFEEIPSKLIGSLKSSKQASSPLQIFGEAFNVCSGKKTTIRELAYLAKKIFKIKEEPQFGSMRKRDWDLADWYGNPEKMREVFGWKAKTSLEEGLNTMGRLVFSPT